MNSGESINAFRLTRRNLLEGKEDNFLCDLVARKYEYRLYVESDQRAQSGMAEKDQTHSSAFFRKFDRKREYQLHGFRITYESVSDLIHP